MFLHVQLLSDIILKLTLEHNLDFNHFFDCVNVFQSTGFTAYIILKFVKLPF